MIPFSIIENNWGFQRQFESLPESFGIVDS